MPVGSALDDLAHAGKPMGSAAAPALVAVARAAGLRFETQFQLII